MAKSYDVVIIGAGPAGIFTALELADTGLSILILEKGLDIRERIALNRDRTAPAADRRANIVSGWGGAGAFSDGKLNTGTKDLRHRFILETLVRCGAPDTILTDARPHVGTDKLHIALQALRQELEAAGVASAKIEGRMKRPEYVAAAVSQFKQALEGQPAESKGDEDS